MNSREIIKAVLTFKNPPRIGMGLPEPYPNDFCWGGRSVPERTQIAPQGHEKKRWKDEFGNTWASLTDFDKGEVVDGAIRDWSDLDSYRMPDLGRWEDYKDAAATFAAEKDKFRFAGMPCFLFNVARNLRKLEDYLCDLAVERENIDRLHAMIVPEVLKMIDCFGRAGADAIMFWEDWGTQDRLMISPAMWREIFKPLYATLCGRAREHGMFVIMHSCGKMTDIIEDLIEVGVACMQFDQPRVHGIDLLAERFGGRMSFWCPVDTQRTLQTRDGELIERDAAEMIRKLGGFGGGFIAGYYDGNEALGITPDVQDIACRAFVKHGTY